MPRPRRGLMYAPDPGSVGISTIGGNIATNAGGLRGAKYGVTRDAVLSVDVVLADGSLVRLGRPTIKGVTGYDLAGLVVGSEGTLGIVVAARVRLLPAPQRVATASAFFATLEDAARAVAAIAVSGARPAVLEILDGATLGAIDAASGTALRAQGGAAARADRRLRCRGGDGRRPRGGRPHRDAPRVDGGCRARRRPPVGAASGAPGARTHRATPHRGHRGSAEPTGGGDQRHPSDRGSPRGADLRVRPRGRRQPASDHRGRAGRGRSARDRRPRRRRHLRPGTVARGDGHRGARRRPTQARLGAARTGGGRRAAARRDQAGVRPARHPEPGGALTEPVRSPGVRPADVPAFARRAARAAARSCREPTGTIAVAFGSPIGGVATKIDRRGRRGTSRARCPRRRPLSARVC